jgi:hypothetical protein
LELGQLILFPSWSVISNFKKCSIGGGTGSTGGTDSTGVKAARAEYAVAEISAQPYKTFLCSVAVSWRVLPPKHIPQGYSLRVMPL